MPASRMHIRNDLKYERAVNFSATMRFIYMQAAQQPHATHKNEKKGATTTRRSKKLKPSLSGRWRKPREQRSAVARCKQQSFLSACRREQPTMASACACERKGELKSALVIYLPRLQWHRCFSDAALLAGCALHTHTSALMR